MEFIWFCIVAFMIAGYVMLDGYDLGTGVIHLWVARSDKQRRQVLQTIGPVWDGNEVFLIAGGGAIFLAFPILYSASFAGFYLPLMIVLWLLILRGVSLDLRSHLDHAMWRQFWDVGFFAASALLSFFLGVALGDVVRGVPLDANHNYFLPLFYDFTVSGKAGVLDWYTSLVGILSFLTLTQHGCLWIAWRTNGEVRERAVRAWRRVWPWTVILVAVVTYFSLRIQPQIAHNLATHGWGFIFPAIALAGLILIPVFGVPERDFKALVASFIYIFGMLTSVAFGLFPYVLPATSGSSYGLTIYNASASMYGLTVALYWYIPGLILVLAYIFYAHSRVAGRIGTEEDGHY